MRNGHAARVGGDTTTMGPGAEQAYHGGVRRQLAGVVVTAVIGLTVVLGLQASGAWAVSYGEIGGPNGGLAVGLGNHGCVGVELWGSPGFFGSLGDSSGCDY